MMPDIMENNSLKFKEEYTTKEFAEEFQFSEKYVRQMCSGYRNTRGTKASLPASYYVSRKNPWCIKPKISPFFANRSRFVFNNRIKDLNTYKDFDFNVYNCMNIMIFKGPQQEEIILYNVLDHLKSDSDLGFFYGDYILYLVAHNLSSEPEVFTNYFYLILSWLQISNIHMSDEFRAIAVKNKDQCLQCGRKIQTIEHIEENIFAKQGYYFCNKTHYENFDKNTRGRTNPSSIYRKLRDLINIARKNKYESFHDVRFPINQIAKNITTRTRRLYRDKSYSQEPTAGYSWEKEQQLSADICKHYDFESLKLLLNKPEEELKTLENQYDYEDLNKIAKDVFNKIKSRKNTPKYTKEFLFNERTYSFVIYPAIREIIVYFTVYDFLWSLSLLRQ